MYFQVTWRPEGRRYQGKRGANVRPSIWRAILTDSHFWVPVVVLAFGIVLLMVIK
jgi:hypothetical protein